MLSKSNLEAILDKIIDKIPEETVEKLSNLLENNSDTKEFMEALSSSEETMTIIKQTLAMEAENNAN